MTPLEGTLNTLTLLLRLGLAVVMGFAAYNKLLDPGAFVFSIEGFRILPDHMIPAAAFLLPWLEAVIAVALFLGLGGRAAAAISAVLLLTFIGGFISVLARDLSVDCGCFGKYKLLCTPAVGTEANPDAGRNFIWCKMGENSLFAAAALLVTIWGPGFFSWDTPFGRRKAAAADSDAGVTYPRDDAGAV
ncbi:MAG: MauE/DoxX family redox-associated membrane protein [Planctomycetota bacterium]